MDRSYLSKENCRQTSNGKLKLKLASHLNKLNSIKRNSAQKLAYITVKICVFQPGFLENILGSTKYLSVKVAWVRLCIIC